MELLIIPARPVRTFEVPHLPALQITPQRIVVAIVRTYRVTIGGATPPPARLEEPEEPQLPLDPAALAWREGRLRKARALYDRALRVRRDDWRAMFQLAWLDAAFGRLVPQATAELDRDDLTAAGRDRLRALAATEHRTSLSGEELSWDVDVLRATGAAESADWWEEHGRAAWGVGLFGVAAVCAIEAAMRSPALRAQPPAWMRVVATDADRHLQRVARAVP